MRTNAICSGFESRPNEIPVSALTGQGIETLKESAINLLAPGGETHGAFITSLRHENLLTEATAMLDKAKAATTAGLPHELLLLDLYCALQPIDAITGVTTADDVCLNRIFSTFCIRQVVFSRTAHRGCRNRLRSS